MRNNDPLHNQYVNSNNLNRRININKLYSTNNIPFWDWVYDNYSLSTVKNIIEIGCGNGEFWYNCHSKLPKKSRLLLTDNSDGMLIDCKKKLQLIKNIKYRKYNLNDKPFIYSSFDTVMAHFMLYHVKTIDKSLIHLNQLAKNIGEIGIITVGDFHCEEIYNLFRYIKNDINIKKMTESFTEKIADTKLKKYFKIEKKEIYYDVLKVTSVEHLLLFIKSIPMIQNSILSNNFFDNLNQTISKNIEKSGFFDINKKIVHYVCRKKIKILSA